MNTRTRNFMFGSAAILVFGLAAGVVGYYGGLPGLAARQAGPDELAYLPADAGVVAYADVAEVMRSDFRQRLRAVMPKDDQEKGRHEFEQATGIDIERDIDAVTCALVPGDGEPVPLAVIRGTFDQGRIEAFAIEKGAVVNTIEGARLISMPDRADAPAEVGEPAEPGEEPPPAPRHRAHRKPAMAFVDTGLVVFGPEAAVRAALVNKRTGQNLTTNAELMGRIATLSGSANAWAIGRMDAITQRASIPQEVAAKLPALTWFEAVGHVNGGIDGTLRAEARDEESARNMRDMLNGFMAFGRLQAQNNPQVQALMQTMQLGGTGKQVELTFRLPGEVLELIAPKPPAPVAVN